MDKQMYHHGDLKRTLIETGINLINESGENSFSLRKVAAMCGVSNAAPYAHFKSKDELLSAMKEHVTQEFMNVLQDVIHTYPHNKEILTRMGKAYVMFFIHNPHYYSFLFSQQDIIVDLNPGANMENNYSPFVLFQGTVAHIMCESGMPAEQINNLVIAMWALVQGLASIATMKNVCFDENWEDKIEEIMKSLTGQTTQGGR